MTTNTHLTYTNWYSNSKTLIHSNKKSSFFRRAVWSLVSCEENVIKTRKLVRKHYLQWFKESLNKKRIKAHVSGRIIFLLLFLKIFVHLSFSCLFFLCVFCYFLFCFGLFYFVLSVSSGGLSWISFTFSAMVSFSVSPKIKQNK